MSKKIRRTPDSWKSVSKENIKTSSGLIMLLIFLGLIFYQRYESNRIWETLIFIGFAFLGFIILLYNNFGPSDTWMLKVPKNVKFFNQLNENIENMLKIKNFSYDKIDKFHQIENAENLHVHYEIKLPKKSNFKIITLYPLIQIRKYNEDKAPSRKTAQIEIANVRSDNIEIIDKIVYDLMFILNKMDYKNIKNEI